MFIVFLQRIIVKITGIVPFIFEPIGGLDRIMEVVNLILDGIVVIIIEGGVTPRSLGDLYGCIRSLPCRDLLSHFLGYDNIVAKLLSNKPVQLKYSISEVVEDLTQIIRQAIPAFLLQISWYSIIPFRYGTSDTGQCITVPTKGY